MVSPLGSGCDGIVVKSTIFIITQEKCFVNRINRFFTVKKGKNCRRQIFPPRLKKTSCNRADFMLY
jgi:hypothetical protein